MKYIVEEIQTFDNGNVSTPAYAYNTREQAERQFHLLVAGAVVSTLPTHAVVMMTNDGRMIEYKSYSHPVVVPEEEPETSE